MPILPIYTFNHPVLKQKAQPIEEITDELAQFVDSMFATMRNADGIGLAANQVGDRRAVTTIDISEMEDDKSGGKRLPPIVLINPVVVAFSDETSDFEEGCLSLPKYRDTVTRPAGAQVRFYDLQMREHTIEADGLLARVMQHEIDHLNGTYFFERLSPVRRAMAHPKLKRIQLGQVATEYPLFDPKAQKTAPRKKPRK